ncbi:MAG: type II toxin-antitoxin system RelE/ParE family toxin [Candidatus Aenigmatarchaeota archaeon]|nr:MAG: type II toxin-antitoxin system RelE/ParE family toxin [Candidatus Aenigmarchaeota archaeon]
MSNYQLEYTKLFIKKLKKFESRIKDRILQAIENILDNPYNGSQLIFSKEKLWKWRVGNYRIIYKIEESKPKIVLIIVDHRKRVYNRFRNYRKSL